MGCLLQGEIKRRSFTRYTTHSLCPPFAKVGPYCVKICNTGDLTQGQLQLSVAVLASLHDLCVMILMRVISCSLSKCNHE